MLTFRVFWRRLRVLKSGTIPVQTDQVQQALDEAGRLTQRHAEQHLHRQAGLDRGIAVVGLSATFAGWRGLPDHLGVEPDRQRTTALQRFIIGGPVPGLVGGGCRSAHAPQLPRWIHKMNPSRDLCNRAASDARDYVLATTFVTGRLPDAPLKHRYMRSKDLRIPLDDFVAVVKELWNSLEYKSYMSERERILDIGWPVSYENQELLEELHYPVEVKVARICQRLGYLLCPTVMGLERHLADRGSTIDDRDAVMDYAITAEVPLLELDQ